MATHLNLLIPWSTGAGRCAGRPAEPVPGLIYGVPVGHGHRQLHRTAHILRRVRDQPCAVEALWGRHNSTGDASVSLILPLLCFGVHTAQSISHLPWQHYGASLLGYCHSLTQ